MNSTHLELITTRTGDYCLKISYYDYNVERNRVMYSNSKIDPIQEAKTWVDAVYEEDIECFIVYGLGLGYHIRALLDRLSTKQMIQVFDSNTWIYEYLAHKGIDYQINDSRVEIYITSQMDKISQILNSQEVKKIKVLLNKPMIKALPEKQKLLQQTLMDYDTRQQSNTRFKKLIEENYVNNNGAYPRIDELLMNIKSKPVIIVSAGPSLEKNIKWLKDVNENCYILATGRAFRTLIEQEIRVDFFCMLDCQYEPTYSQIINLEEMKVPLIFLNTSNHQTIAAYEGPKYIAYSEDSPEGTLGRMETGGSVATLALSISIAFRAETIIFVGQDLAFTEGRTHAQSVGGYKMAEEPNMKKVKGINGEYINTTSGLLSFKHWIEHKISQHANIEFINCTEGGAFIEGARHQELYRTLKDLDCLSKQQN